MTGLPQQETGALSLSGADVVRFCEYFYRRTGIQFGLNKRYFVDKRIQQAMADRGASSFATWFADLRLDTDPRAFQDVVNLFTVNETYFMREDYQLDALVRSILPQVMHDRARLGVTGPVRILSLPSSTGEEPYSIAIRVLEDWPQIATVDVQISAADIDSRVLDQARGGVYGQRSLHRLPETWRRAYFTQVDATHFEIRADVRAAVDFSLLNLTDQVAMRRVRGFDVIFCRNLLIYFDASSARLAAENLHEALRPGGFLLLGHSESMSRISSLFTPRRFPEALVYQRPLPGGSA